MMAEEVMALVEVMAVVVQIIMVETTTTLDLLVEVVVVMAEVAMEVVVVAMAMVAMEVVVVAIEVVLEDMMEPVLVVVMAHPGADPPPGSEGDELEVVPPEVDVLVRAAGEEPGRAELERVRPRRRVVGDGPDVDEQRRAPGNVVAAHLARLRRHAREGKRRGRVEPERLLDDGLQEAQVGEVGLGDEPGSADYRVELPLGLLEDFRVSDELRQRPLHRAR
ncbi:hypothetical protein GW17_00037878 [Ensete ventricosum]|nr:hypothetical protein GW17_00037878 [Ensete ventricosum]